MLEAGKKPWTYGATRDVALVQRLDKAGFQMRYSLRRRRILGWQTIKGKTPKLDKALAAEVSAGV
jgi:hypothetical protein